MKQLKSLDELLQNYNVAGLKELVKEFGVTGYSKMRKAELAECLKNIILEEALMEDKFLFATKEELVRLEQAMSEIVVKEEDSYLYYYWEALGFVLVGEDKVIKVPAEIKTYFDEITALESFKTSRNRMEEMTKYMLASTNLYNLISVSKLVEIINGMTTLNVSEEEIISMCQRREYVRGVNLFCYQDGYVMDEVYGENIFGVVLDYKEMLKSQADKPFYLPEAEEFLKYEDGFYIEENDSYKDMTVFLKSNMKMSESKAEDVASEIQMQIRNNVQLEVIFDELEKMHVKFSNEKAMRRFTRQLLHMVQNTRLPENRAYTFTELNEMFPGKYGTENMDVQDDMVQQTTVQKTEPKIYPNDPCPCGSGKKYKKCCGR